jgi:hypothetical protein
VTLRSALVRAATLTAVLALWCAAYIAALLTHPDSDGGVGGANVIIPLTDALPTFAPRLSWVWKQLGEWKFIRDSSVGVGFAAARAQPVWSVLLGAVLTVTTIPTCRWLLQTTLGHEAPLTEPPRVPLVCAGAACVLHGSLLPVAAVDAPVRPRLTYLSWMALCVVDAALADLARSRLPLRPHRPAGIAALALGAWPVGASCRSMIGTQVLFRERARMDARTAARFRAHLPDPPPDTVFFVLWPADWPRRTRNDSFNHFPMGALAFSWSYPTFLKHAYRRADIECLTTSWFEPPVLAANERAVVPAMPVRHGARMDGVSVRLPPGGWEQRPGVGAVAWDRVVLLELREDGTVVLVERVTIDRGDGTAFTVKPPRGALWKGPCRAKPWPLTVPAY